MNQANSALKSSRPALMPRAAALFVNLMLVILAYYQVKAASRSLLLEFGGADAFPYVWIGSAIALLGFIGIYNRLVSRFSRPQIVLGSLVSFAALLVIFHTLLDDANVATVVAFYIFVDLFSVVLVEQFWSLANTVTADEEGRKSYWFIASGGLVGGIAGGLLASALIEQTSMQTVDLLLSCAALLMVTAGVNALLGQSDMLKEHSSAEQVVLTGDGLAAVVGNRYLLLIALVVLLSQLAEPVVEYQFLSAVGQAFSDTDERTQFISKFFSVMGVVSIGVNLLLTPMIHRHLGAIAGMAVQPLMLATVSLGFAVQSGLMMASAMKIADRGLSYSINRASKEILFIPVDPMLTYQAKAWIDMLGYRTFKVIGSALIVGITSFASSTNVGQYLTLLTVAICLVWLVAVGLIKVEQQRLLNARDGSDQLATSVA